jgi:hypothetical protein
MGGSRIEAEKYRTGGAGMKTEAHGGPRQLEKMWAEKKRGNFAWQHELQDAQTESENWPRRRTGTWATGRKSAGSKDTFTH